MIKIWTLFRLWLNQTKSRDKINKNKIKEPGYELKSNFSQQKMWTIRENRAFLYLTVSIMIKKKYEPTSDYDQIEQNQKIKSTKYWINEPGHELQ